MENSLEEMIVSKTMRFEEVDSTFFLIGLLSAFDNRYQAKADTFFEDISWKQFFAVISLNLCKEVPTINEMAEIMGSSHQNVKKILSKLESRGYVEIKRDEKDRRKQRVYLTEKMQHFNEAHEEGGKKIVNTIFEGIDEEDIQTTIRTIMHMEKNLNKI